MRGLTIVLPKHASERAGLLFFHDNRAWVEKRLTQAQPKIPSVFELQPEIFLPGIQQKWLINYRITPAAKRVTCNSRDRQLIFSGPIRDFSCCVLSVKTWLKKQARHHLSIFLEQLSRECNLPYANLSIRAQKTVWGSCTAKNNIQLNYKLLFLPRDTMRYVLIHELCHTLHHNHSRRFWRAVEQFVPNYRAQVKALKSSDIWMPGWLHGA